MLAICGLTWWRTWGTSGINLHNRCLRTSNTILLLTSNGRCYPSLVRIAREKVYSCVGEIRWLCPGTSISVRAPVAKWIKHWSTDLAVPSSSPARGDIFSTVNGVPLHTAFNYQSLIVLIWLKYCWKGRKITTHASISYDLC